MQVFNGGMTVMKLVQRSFRFNVQNGFFNQFNILDVVFGSAIVYVTLFFPIAC